MCYQFGDHYNHGGGRTYRIGNRAILDYDEKWTALKLQQPAHVMISYNKYGKPSVELPTMRCQSLGKHLSSVSILQSQKLARALEIVIVILQHQPS